MSRVLGYIRVSTSRQATEGTSLEGQRAVVLSCAAANGLPEPEIRTEVEGAGEERQEKRVVLNKLLAELAKGDVLIVPKIDRFSRDTLFTLQAVARFRAVGARLISAAENLDPANDDGYMYLTIQASFAQREKARIKERTIGRRRALREQGLRVEGKDPLGYTHADRRYVVDPVGAEIVRFVFARCLAGVSSRDTRDEVLARFGRRLDDLAVSRMLRNRTYLGETQTWARSTGEASGVWMKTHEPIIDLPTFERARLAVAERRRGGRKPKRELDSLLRGIGKCAVCGASLYVRANNANRNPNHQGWYVCGHRGVGKQTTTPCPNGALARREVVDAEVSDAVVGRLAALREALLAPRAEARAVVPRIDLEAARRRSEARRARLLDAFGDGLMDKVELRERLAKVDAELATLELQAADEPVEETPAERVRHRLELEGMAKAWAKNRNRHKVLRALAKEVRLAPDGEVHMAWKTRKGPDLS